MNKAIIIEPFWGHPQRVSVLRVERFVRWLATQGVEIILVRAGKSDRVQDLPWGKEITVRDPLRVYGDVVEGNYTVPVRRPNPLRRWLAVWMLCPDTGVVWARRAAHHPLVLEHGHAARWVISSSPRESVHVASRALAGRLGASLVIDMRDGWLDEPLKPLLQRYRFQRWREGRLEKSILRQADCIFVTSELWKEMLERRLPFTQGKVTVLTNAYPPQSTWPDHGSEARLPSNTINLLHVGRFTGSRPTQKVSHLLQPLLEGIRRAETTPRGEVVLLGDLEPEDAAEAKSFGASFDQLSWSLKVCASVPRAEAWQRSAQADGLLLLSASRAALPSKLFEYIPTRRPILAVTLRDSAVWRLAGLLPQLFLVDYTQPQATPQAVRDFLLACVAGTYSYETPLDFTEERLSQVFLETIGGQ